MGIPKLLVLFMALTIGNFIYQAATKQDWGLAVERSFFQGIALALAATL